MAVLIDPEKSTDGEITRLIKNASCEGIDFFLVGGSILSRSIDAAIDCIKANTNKLVIIFPGNACQVSAKADGILYLSLISGRNPEFLIGNHVISAPIIKKAGLQTIATGYVLIDCGSSTSVQYMSGTMPIPYSKNDIAIATALAGEMLGLQAIYLEAGSGADKHVSATMIADVKKNLHIPLIVGGGIRSKEDLIEVYQAGADIAVVGTALEKDAALLSDFIAVKHQMNNSL